MNTNRCGFLANTLWLGTTVAAGSAAAFVQVDVRNDRPVATAVETVAGKAKSLLPPGRSWKLVWHDEFDGKEIDRTKWMCRESFWGKDFPAFAHDFEGVEMTGETVKLNLLCKDGQFSSPHLQTGSLTYDIPKDTDGLWPFGAYRKPLFMHRYGYYEIRCRQPKHPGWHSAFWLQAPGVGSSSDPSVAGIETDIMENYRQFVDGKIVGGNGWNGYGSDSRWFGHFSWDYEEYEDGWCHYGVDWSPKGYTFYANGKRIGEQNDPVSHVPQFILVSTEPRGYRNPGSDGGLTAGQRTWGKPDSRLFDIPLPDTFEVDFVRVYDAVEQGTEPKPYDAAADGGSETPFVMLRSYGTYEDNKAFTERAFAAQERHPGLIEEIWFGGCGDPFSTPDEMGRVAAKGNLSARERCRRLGIRFSYQDGVTLNHGPDGVRHAGIPEDAWAVDRAGKPVYGVFCCTSPFVKDFCREKAKAILSALRPSSFWPDDDLRLSKVGKAPAICFCNRCLGLFGARVGRSFDREGLLTELKGPAASAETRRAWCAFNGEALGEFAKVYREAADAVSPETFVGQQLTVASAAVNGDSWRRILETYGADGRATGVRPGGGYYSDQDPFALIGKMVDVAKTAARVSRLGCVKQVCYEAETWPHIGSLKSPGGLMAECAYALASGCDSLALYWGADINGETDESYDFFFDTLAAWKPFLLAERTAFRGTVPGGLAQFVGADRFADEAWTSTFDMWDAAPLARNGLPLADAEGSPDAYFLNARSVRTLSRGDFATVFAKPVLMDVKTFSALAARFPGLDFVKKVGIVAPPEEKAAATDLRPAGFERFAGGRCEGVKGLIRPLASDVVRLSEMTADPAACGTCVIPTAFGGAVVLVQDMSFKSYPWAGSQMSWAGCRRRGILDALDRAVPGRLPARLLTDGYACVVVARKDADGRTTGAFVMNFGTGETPPLELGIRRTAVRDWEVFGPKGRVAVSGRADGDGVIVRLPPLPAFGVAVIVANQQKE